MLENEVDYRLAKMLLGCLYHDGLLTVKTNAEGLG